MAGYDYSSEGCYFITICTKDRVCFLGKIENRKFKYSPIGAIAYTYWNKIPKHFTHVRLGEFVIMPNHIHGIIEIVSPVRPPHGVALHSSSGLSVGDTPWRVPTGLVPQSPQDFVKKTSNNTNKFGKTIPGSLSAIIGQFKSSVTRWCNKNDFILAWQSRFHDHIIRNEPEYERIEQYIIEIHGKKST